MVNVYYHSEDLDGICSMFIMAFYFKQMHEWDSSTEEVSFIPCKHGMKNPTAEDLIGVSKIFFCDYFPSPYEDALLLGDVPVTVLDHHVSSLKWISEHPEFKHKDSILSTNFAGCELTWKYCFPFASVPKSVRLLGLYDRWVQTDATYNWKSHILPFQYGVRNAHGNKKPFWRNLFLSDDPLGNQSIMETGKLLVNWEIEHNARLAKHAFEAEFDGKQFICINSLEGNSDLFATVYDPWKHAGMLKYGQKKDMTWSVSLYTTRKDVDVSEIARKHLGGGHSQAAGFQATTLYITGDSPTITVTHLGLDT